MNVIRNPANSDCGAANCVQRTCEVSEQAIANGRRNQWFAVFCAENEVNDISGERLRHGAVSCPSLSGWKDIDLKTWGDAPGYVVPALRAEEVLSHTNPVRAPAAQWFGLPNVLTSWPNP